MIVSGALVELKSAKRETFEQILRKHIEHELTGYILYKAKNIFIIIGLVDGSIASCRAITLIPSRRALIGTKTRKKIIDGAECCELVVRYLRDRTGMIAVYESNYDVVSMNIINTPTARVESNVGFTSLLKLNTGLVKTTYVRKPSIPEQPPVVEKPSIPEVTTQPQPPTPTPPPQPPTIEPTQPKPVAESVETPIAPREEAPPVPTRKISGECIDPTVLFTVMKTSQLEDSLMDIELEKALDRVVELSSLKKTNTVYARGLVEDSTIRILYSAQTNTMYIETEILGETKCGEDALTTLRNKKAKYLHIMIST